MDVETLYENRFVVDLRNESRFDQREFDDLVAMLSQLKIELVGQATIEKPVALFLYTAPQMVYGVYSRLDDQQSDFARQLSDAWLQLDAIATEILTN